MTDALLPHCPRSMLPDRPIDVVYTWVDGTRPDYLRELQRHSSTPRDLNPERYRDSYELLRHSLRSLERYAPWVRNIYLLTCRPQVPSWLRTDHPRLRVVHHDEIVPDSRALPTFSSNVIELWLHRLPGISDHFLYFNDDYFLSAPVEPADFYARDGRLKIWGTLVGERFRSRIYERQILSFGLVEHAPIMIDREAWASMQTLVASELAQPELRRFRGPRDIRPERLYRWYMLTHARQHAVAEPFWSYLRSARFLKIKNDPSAVDRSLASLRRDRPKFFCLNDDQRAAPNAEVVAFVRTFLRETYPRPSSFERVDS